MQRFPAALRLFEKINDEAAGTDSALAKRVLGVTDLDIAVLSSTEERDVLLYIEATAAHSQG